MGAHDFKYLVDDALLFVFRHSDQLHRVPRHFAAFQRIVGLVHRFEGSLSKDFVELPRTEIEKKWRRLNKVKTKVRANKRARMNQKP